MTWGMPHRRAIAILDFGLRIEILQNSERRNRYPEPNIFLGLINDNDAALILKGRNPKGGKIDAFELFVLLSYRHLAILLCEIEK